MAESLNKKKRERKMAKGQEKQEKRKKNKAKGLSKGKKQHKVLEYAKGIRVKRKK